MDPRNFNILIIDDEPDARALLGIALQNDQWTLRLAESGAEGIRLCDEQIPDLAIVDFLMPGTSGIEICQRIKEKAAQAQTFVPVILITSQTELCDKKDSLNLGADDYVKKPFSFAELEAQVRALLRIKVLTDDLHQTKNLLAQKEKELIAMQIAGAASHELGQPLTSLILNLEALTRCCANQPETAEIVSAIQQDAAALREIHSNLRNVSSYRTKAYSGGLSILDLTSKPIG